MPRRSTRRPARRSAKMNWATSTWFSSPTTTPGNLDRTGRAYLQRVPPVLTTTTAAERLDAPATGMRPWSAVELERPEGGTVTVTAVPAQHGPDGTDHLTGPVVGFVLE